MSQRRYVLAHLTLLDVPPPELVTIAAQAGYDGVTLDLSIPSSGVRGDARYPMLGDSPMMRETLACLKDSGLMVQDVQAVRLNERLRIDLLGPFFEAAQALGARYLMTVSDESDPMRVADQLGALADAAAPFGITPVLEFMVYGGVPSLRHANDILDKAARPNLALMVDTLHLCRSGGDAHDLARTDVRRMPYIQVCDAAIGPAPLGTAALRAEALTNRRFPGDGGLPLVEWLSALPADIALSIEVPMLAAYAPESPLDRAREALRKTKAVVSQCHFRQGL